MRLSSCCSCFTREKPSPFDSTDLPKHQSSNQGGSHEQTALLKAPQRTVFQKNPFEVYENNYAPISPAPEFLWAMNPLHALGNTLSDYPVYSEKETREKSPALITEQPSLIPEKTLNERKFCGISIQDIQNPSTEDTDSSSKGVSKQLLSLAMLVFFNEPCVLTSTNPLTNTSLESEAFQARGLNRSRDCRVELVSCPDYHTQEYRFTGRVILEFKDGPTGQPPYAEARTDLYDSFKNRIFNPLIEDPLHLQVVFDDRYPSASKVAFDIISPNEQLSGTQWVFNRLVPQIPGQIRSSAFLESPPAITQAPLSKKYHDYEYAEAADPKYSEIHDESAFVEVDLTIKTPEPTFAEEIETSPSEFDNTSPPLFYRLREA